MHFTLALITFTLLLLLIWYVLTRDKKHKNTLNEEFKASWKDILKEYVSFYNELNEEQQSLFEKRILNFLHHVKVTAVKTEITDLDRLLVASSAIIPIFGYPGWEYPNLNEVLIHDSHLNDTEFGQQAENGYILGMVGTGKLEGKMLLSKGALREGFRNDNDKKNVGIHEFVHLIDMADGKIDGIPEVLLQKSYTLPWMNLMHQKIEEILNKDSDINPYGATNVQEFLTVTSEYFFERPNLLKKNHPELYENLALIFNQNMSEQEKKFETNKLKDVEIGRNDLCLCGSKKKYKKCCGK
ncbi:peptidase [Flammeovirga pectinis]|uniref:Peptidase n=1 Tax=Flammeovirga pectinis TaxID=2494373 RepID=A0A3Q9FPQ3_9BACT|nr:M90 family metallopeptidase [Flammeovirga pectinis]AZQ63081.1 peptidase [Flammeovirga pectinis]